MNDETSRAATIQETLTEGKRLLAGSCPLSLIDTPALDAALLLGEVMRKSRTDLLAHGNEAVSDTQREQFLRLVQRRKDGECVAYILGRREFRGLEFCVNPQVLVPRPDTETLVEAALERGAGLRILDLCTGSGALAIALKNERPALCVSASDISPAALETARQNAGRLLSGGADTICFIQSDLFADISGTFDIIVSNPPYIPSGEWAALPPEVRREPRLALDGGGDGLDLIRKITAQAGKHLSPGGVLLLEAAPGQMQAIRSLLQAHGFGGVNIYKDLAGRERVISGDKTAAPCQSTV